MHKMEAGPFQFIPGVRQQRSNLSIADRTTTVPIKPMLQTANAHVTEETSLVEHVTSCVTFYLMLCSAQ